MDRISTRFSKQHYLILLSILLSTCLSAQLTVERELFGATIATDDSSGGLQVTSSFGEPIIGLGEGDLIITTGFQQPDLISPENFNLESRGTIDRQLISVKAFPNPTTELLTVDLGNSVGRFRMLQLLDVNGRAVASQQVAERRVLSFDRIAELPAATYYLQGVDHEGKPYALASILVATKN